MKFSAHISPAQSYVRSSLRQQDRLSYTHCLFFPADRRAGAEALCLFFLELDRLAAKVSQPLIGEIRLQWWRDFFANTNRAESLAHPLALCLNEAIDRFRLPERVFSDMIEARRFDLYHHPMPDEAALELYLGSIYDAQFRLLTLILQENGQIGGIENTGFAGQAWGLLQILKKAPNAARQGRCFLPQDYLVKHGVEVSDFCERQEPPLRLGALIKEMRLRISDYASRVRPHLNASDPAAKLAYLPLSLLPYYERQLLPSRFPSRPIEEPSPLRIFWTFWTSTRRWR